MSQNNSIEQKLIDSGMTKAEAKTAMATVFAGLKSDLMQNGSAAVPGIGTLKVQLQAARSERQGRNPRTGEALTVAAKPAKFVVKFKTFPKMNEVAANYQA